MVVQAPAQGVPALLVDKPIIILMADKTSAGAWNLPLYKMFADPFNTAGLIIAPTMHEGFRFEVHDVKGHQRIFFECPEEFLRSPSVHWRQRPLCHQGGVF